MDKINSDKKNSILHEENKKKKQMLENEFGMINCFESASEQLPPEVESLFLDNIMAYEKGIRNAKRTTVYQLMNSPAYRKISELSDEEVEAELDRIIAILLEHQLILDTFCEVSKKELYRFITEELFSEEINDVIIPNMFTHFVYDEFHPNHEYDIREQSYDFLSTYFDISSDFYKFGLTSQAVEQKWHIHFRNAFSKFDFKAFSILDLHYDLDLKDAHVDFICEILAMTDGSHECVRFKGQGKLHFVYENNFWCVNSVELPAPQSNQA